MIYRYLHSIIYITIILLMFVTSDLSAQEQSSNSPISISAHLGAFKNQDKYFKLQYDTDTFLSYGLELNVPLNKISKRFGFMGKVTWMSATGVPILIHMDLKSMESSVIRVEEGISELSKRVSNVGIKVNFPIKGNFKIDIMGGLNHVFVKQISRNIPDWSDYESKGSLWDGYFGGLGMEYTFVKAPISITSNVFYNQTFPSLVGLFGNNGGYHLSIGLRYYSPIGI